jgi:hypothetical protein
MYYKSLCHIPQPLVDALQYGCYRQPGWSNQYYRLVCKAYSDWVYLAAVPYRKQQQYILSYNTKQLNKK